MAVAPAYLRRLLLPSLVLTAVLVPGLGEAQPVVTTTSTSAQYSAPASRAPLQKQNPGQPARVFSGVVAAPANIASCPPPTLAQCKSTSYLFSGCGQAHQKTCQGLLKNDYAAYYNALPGPANRQMFPYGTAAKFSDLKSGKFHGTVPTSPVMVRSKSFWDQTRIVNAPPSANPKTYVPHPDWEADGAAVKTCEEYAYEKYYDWQRFQDAVTLCKGDYVCAYEVAYVLNGPPGIAKRTLKRKDGADLAGQVKPAMPTPKNVFFTMGPYVTTTPTGVGKDGKPRSFLGFMPFADLKTKFPSFAADLDQLKVALDDGAVFYGTSAGGGVNAVYPNKWDFHSAMRNKTANVTENEFEEFERRRAELEFYVASIRPVDSGGGGGHFGLREAEFVHPLDEVSQVMTYDPWERADMFQDESVRNSVLVNAHQGAIQQNHAALFGPNGAALKAPGSSVLRSGGGTMIQTGAGNGATAGNGRTAAVAGLNKVIKVKAPSTMTFMGPQVDCDDPSINVPPMDVEACEANANNCKGLAGPDAMRNQNQANWNYYAKCKILNVTLAEWWRRKAGLAQGCNDRGSCGCLDLSTAACDWSPKMFYDAYIAQPPGLSVASYQDGNLSKPADMSYLRDADYDNCKAWTYAGFPKNAADRASGDALEAYLQARREEIEKTLKKIPQKKNGSQFTGVLGEDFSDGAQEGDTDSWSAGYSMNAGWELKAAEFKPKTSTEAKKTCQLQGNANASFAVKITTPIDGVLGDNFARLWNHAVDADVWVRANENKDQKVRYETHLLIADQELFAAPKPYAKYKHFKDYPEGTYESISLNKTFEKPLLENTKKTTKLTLTVWAGPIPITGSVWAELSYGANAIAKGAMGSGCNADMSTFEAKAGFEPYFNLSGALSLGVGIGGIVSAGIRGYLTLIDARLPIVARTWLNGSGTSRKLNFGVDAALNLSSLGGRLSLYVEFLLYEEEWELFHWRGVHTSIPILRAVDEKFDFLALAAITP